MRSDSGLAPDQRKRRLRRFAWPILIAGLLATTGCYYSPYGYYYGAPYTYGYAPGPVIAAPVVAAPVVTGGVVVGGGYGYRRWWR